MRPVMDHSPSYQDMLLFSTTRLDRGHCLQSEMQNNHSWQAKSARRYIPRRYFVIIIAEYFGILI